MAERQQSAYPRINWQKDLKKSPANQEKTKQKFFLQLARSVISLVESPHNVSISSIRSDPKAILRNLVAQGYSTAEINGEAIANITHAKAKKIVLDGVEAMYLKFSEPGRSLDANESLTVKEIKELGIKKLLEQLEQHFSATKSAES